MGDVSSVLFVGRGVIERGKIMGRIGLGVFAISTGLEVTSVFLFGRHLYQYEESTINKEERMKRMR